VLLVDLSPGLSRREHPTRGCALRLVDSKDPLNLIVGITRSHTPELAPQSSIEAVG
jgi:hypothetical protein